MCLTLAGARNEFESPTRSQNSAFPSLRPAAGQTTLFSNLPRPPSPKKPLPPTPLDAFRTPRKFDIDLSSGGETPNTPDNLDADSEATPDMRLPWMSPSRNHAPPQEERKTSPKKRRESLFDRIWSPSRSALKPYSTKAEKRVVKRRTHRRMFSRSRQTEEAESEPERAPKDAGKQGNGGVHGFLSSYLKLVEQHPNAPSILITYLQLMSNFLLVVMSMYVVWTLWCGILGDVDKGVNESRAEAMLEIVSCRKDWVLLRCEEKMERTREVCENIAKCIARDPETVARAQVSARTFARIINDFAEPISLKAMVRFLSFEGGDANSSRFSTSPSSSSSGGAPTPRGTGCAANCRPSTCIRSNT
jgi:Di-sulfide bridge nucleocytoplasmic transport domain